jgi:exosortase
MIPRLITTSPAKTTGLDPVSPRHLLVLFGFFFSLVVFCLPLDTLVRLAMHDDRYTSTLVVPFLTVVLIWLRRTTIFRDTRPSLPAGLTLALPGLLLFIAATLSAHIGAEYVLVIDILSFLLVCTGVFVGCYGTHAARAAAFPLLFLLLMVPIPSSLLDHAVVALQSGSAEMSYRLFRLIGVPVFREDLYTLSLPGVTIQVAGECSGIRSGQALFIASVAAGYFFLQSGWSRASLALLTIPVAVLKNAVRIVAISWLGVYIDPRFLSGQLHRYGGLPFSLLALLLLAPALLLLMKAESCNSKKRA